METRKPRRTWIRQHARANKRQNWGTVAKIILCSSIPLSLMAVLFVKLYMRAAYRVLEFSQQQELQQQMNRKYTLSDHDIKDVMFDNVSANGGENVVTGTVETPSLRASGERSRENTGSSSSSMSTTATTTALIPFVTQFSEYAYVTLISGIDQSFKYRGFLYNALIMKRSLKEEGSKADFIALMGFSEHDISPFHDDLNLLTSHGIIVYILPRFLDKEHKLGFAEMALLKITPYSFTQYKRIQFFDGDVMPTKNMDCFFNLNINTFTIGAVSPLNSGWYVAIPEMKAYEYMKEKALWRLSRDWDMQGGWDNKPIPSQLTVRGGIQKPKKWDFNGADMDQGLLCHYFIIKFGNGMLIDTQLKISRKYTKGLEQEMETTVDNKVALGCCGSNNPNPLNYFAHFTGRSKPWMQEGLSKLANNKRNEMLIKWANMLDSFEDLPMNSKNIHEFGMRSPLGFFNAGFPKGGFKPKKGKGDSSN